MKQMRFLMVIAALALSPAARAQDSATDQRLNELSGKIEELIAGQDVQRKQVEALAKEIRNLHERINTPSAAYASQEDLKRLAESVKEIDRKRLDDNEKIRGELSKLLKTLSAPLPASKKSAAAEDKPAPRNESGFEYVVQKNDTLSLIVKACREKNIKVTADQILKANPNLKPERLQVGQKIFIPAPQS
jgi:LysM repeat protein